MEECNELELCQSVADADTRAGAEGAMRLTHLTVLTLAVARTVELVGRRELHRAPVREIEVRDAGLEVAVNELPAGTEDVRKLRLETLRTE